MANIDIRGMDEDDVIDSITFADPDDACFSIATHIEASDEDARRFSIHDSTGDYVIVHSKKHAENLIKAINKAIELGFVK